MRRQALAALAAVGLADDADLTAATLSLGNQRLLEIARAMVSEPKLILLDEPASGISEQEGEHLLKLLLRINSERNIAMLVIEHNIPFIAKLCRTMSVMGAGLEALTQPSNNTTSIVIGSQQQASQVASIALQKQIDIPVTIKVPQGTPVQVFLTRDLDFGGVAAAK